MISEKDLNQGIPQEETGRPVGCKAPEPLETGLKVYAPWVYVTYALGEAYKRSNPLFRDKKYYFKFLNSLLEVLNEDVPEEFQRKPLTFQDRAGI